MNAASAANGPIEIRIRNASGMNFDRVRVVFPDKVEVDYGAVAKGALSAFRAANQAYRYAPIYVKAGDREFSQHPIDYVGEQPLAPGRYTYVVRIEGGRLSNDLERSE
jgi:hypothetical protein